MNGNTLIKILSAIVIAAFLMILLIMGRGNEDTWICVAGKWAKHGNPSASMPPISECR